MGKIFFSILIFFISVTVIKFSDKKNERKTRSEIRVNIQRAKILSQKSGNASLKCSPFVATSSLSLKCIYACLLNIHIYTHTISMHKKALTHENKKGKKMRKKMTKLFQPALHSGPGPTPNTPLGLFEWGTRLSLATSGH